MSSLHSALSFFSLYKRTPPSPPPSPTLATSSPPNSPQEKQEDKAAFWWRPRKIPKNLLYVFFFTTFGARSGDYINMAIVIDKFILGTFFASLFGFFLLCILRQKRQNRENKQKFKEKAAFKTRNCNVRRPEDDSGPDVIIVGAGVAGAALACTLGKVKRASEWLFDDATSSMKAYEGWNYSWELKDGRRVHVIERDLTEPDRIVGELLQPGGYLKLIELGLEDCLEEIDAQRVLGYALFKDGKNTRLPYPLENFHSDVAGRSFHNGRFIQRMREKAATMPNVKLVQGTVTSLLEENGTIKGVQYKTKDGQELRVYAPLTVVCDGCFSNLRRSLCNPKVDVPSSFVGLVLENCQLPFENHGHVILADPSPILFYPISSTEVRCLVDVPGQRVPSVVNGEMAKYLKDVVALQIPPVLHDAFISAVDKASLTKYLESFYTLRKPVASTINTLAGALYKVFSASPDQARKEMREACFDYLSLGGIFSSGPVALLSGLNPHPLSLVLHFFAVAIYGVGRLLLPFPSPKAMWIGARIIASASGIIFPIIKAEGVRQMFFPATVPAIYRHPPVKDKEDDALESR
ncbi:squalene epoxidase 3 isoform X5 [Hevea brasiliensis]|uniref:squalene epoxidase 3 isoform X5 n=1 Tax=Hevea brasiliensis TaxID=3981 RepID=UPI0025FFAB22|nr:squalene epoxidase 3 isoform X5 [Hevea brasiliensis]